MRGQDSYTGGQGTAVASARSRHARSLLLGGSESLRRGAQGARFKTSFSPEQGVTNLRAGCRTRRQGPRISGGPFPCGLNNSRYRAVPAR